MMPPGIRRVLVIAAWLTRSPLRMTPPGSRRVLVMVTCSESLELPASNWRVLREAGWSRAVAAVWPWRGSSLAVAGSHGRSWKRPGWGRARVRWTSLAVAWRWPDG